MPMRSAASSNFEYVTRPSANSSRSWNTEKTRPRLGAGSAAPARCRAARVTVCRAPHPTRRVAASRASAPLAQLPGRTQASAAVSLGLTHTSGSPRAACCSRDGDGRPDVVGRPPCCCC
eukprot:365330-Chlamydomonas_euryale.AAC.2